MLLLVIQDNAHDAEQLLCSESLSALLKALPYKLYGLTIGVPPKAASQKIIQRIQIVTGRHRAIGQKLIHLAVESLKVTEAAAMKHIASQRPLFRCCGGAFRRTPVQATHQRCV